MELQHINLKFFIENGASLNLESFHGVFNKWIQKGLTDDLLVDVAEYLHVHHGPGIMLIGHSANYSLVLTVGRLGLLYNRKEQVEGTNRQKLIQAAHAALSAMWILEKENRVRFIGSEMQIIINDRLLVPNTTETFVALKDDLEAFFGILYNGAEVNLVHQANESRLRFIVDVKSASAFDTQTLLDNISADRKSVV